MKHIPLTKGHVALVDDDDYLYLAHYLWHSRRTIGSQTPYAAREVRIPGPGRKRKVVFMHKEILKVESSKRVDHRDGDGLNNQRYNLRAATHLQNVWNQRKRTTNKSGFKGVAWHKQNRKWQANIQADNKFIYLGIFATAEEAAHAYDAAALKHFGEFARLNFPPKAA